MESEIKDHCIVELGIPDNFVAKPRAKVHHKDKQNDVLKSFTTKKDKALVKGLISS